jgi:hypothetical protein
MKKNNKTNIDLTNISFKFIDETEIENLIKDQNLPNCKKESILQTIQNVKANLAKLTIEIKDRLSVFLPDFKFLSCEILFTILGEDDAWQEKGKIEVDLCRLSCLNNQIDELLLILTHECYHLWQYQQTLESKSDYKIINNNGDKIYIILLSLNEGFATAVTRQNVVDHFDKYMPEKYCASIAFEKFNEFLMTPSSDPRFEGMKKDGFKNLSYFYTVPYEIFNTIEKYLGIEVIREDIRNLDFFKIFYQYESLCLRNDKLLKIDMRAMGKMIIPN